MGTGALIGLVHKDGTATTAVLRNDGYLNGAGVTLHKYWTSHDDVEKLVNRGDISCLPESYYWETEPDFTTGSHDEPGYYSSGDFPGESDGLESDNYFVNGFVHVYIFKDGIWYYREINEKSELGKQLEESMKEYEENERKWATHLELRNKELNSRMELFNLMTGQSGATESDIYDPDVFNIARISAAIANACVDSDLTYLQKLTLCNYILRS